VILDGQGERVEALEIYRQSWVGDVVALLAGVAPDSMGDHAAAKDFYRSGWTTTMTPSSNHLKDQYQNIDPDTALHLMRSRIRVSDHVGAAKLRSRIDEHIASSADCVLSTPVGLNPSTHYFTCDMLQLALDNSFVQGGLILEFGSITKRQSR
jgi:hypothetical protein